LIDIRFSPYFGMSIPRAARANREGLPHRQLKV
jgi:hypothetical protein